MMIQQKPRLVLAPAAAPSPRDGNGLDDEVLPLGFEAKPG